MTETVKYFTKIPFKLSNEQEMFIQRVLEGNNVLVDACIGSGKTTAIQHLCNVLPSNKKILYLTYNKLLKIDAKSKIKNKNAIVTNYHGFAYICLKRLGINAGISDLIQTFNKKKPIVKYDILIIDEYQDIEQELADMLKIIKDYNPELQIVAVGDMKQKIYDKTTLNVENFIDKFLGNYVKLEFTQCFRLSADHAAKLGRIWEKKIVGVNSNCKVQYMTPKEVVKFIAKQDPKDILCLGARTGEMARVLNKLEQDYPDKFNKNTVFASISDHEERATEPNADSCIFTTFDSSKGLERKICVVFDFTEDYWITRLRQPQQSYQILRNIFCVAASRGKERIIFVIDKNKELLSEKSLSTNSYTTELFKDVNISEMFDFKFKENIEECFNLLNITKLQVKDNSIIDIENRDGLIDLSPCIGIYQEARFFQNYNIDKAIALCEDLKFKNNLNLRPMRSSDETQPNLKQKNEKIKKLSVEEKILRLVAMETSQARYVNQVKVPFVSSDGDKKLRERLATIFSPNEQVQVRCDIDFYDWNGDHIFTASGFCDVLKNNIVYELKFVEQLSHEHFLQCACYMIALNKKLGIIWNTKTNDAYEIRIPDKRAFMDAVTKTITKTVVCKYYGPLKLQ